MSKCALFIAVLATRGRATPPQIDACCQMRQLPPPPEPPATFSIEPRAVEPDSGSPGKFGFYSSNVVRLIEARSASIAACCALSLLFLGAENADAQITAVAGGSPGHIDLAIPVTASVSNRCSFTIGGTFTASDLNAGFTHDFEIVLQCNVASRMGVVSTNGGLLAAVPAPPQGYARLAPYRVMLNLVGNTGIATVNAVCDVATLSADAAVPCSFRGPASPTQGLRLSGPSSGAAGSYLSVSAVPYAGVGTLVASSTYADTLVVTLSISI